MSAKIPQSNFLAQRSGEGVLEPSPLVRTFGRRFPKLTRFLA